MGGADWSEIFTELGAYDGPVLHHCPVIADVVATVVGVGIIAFALVRVLERGQRT